MYILLKSYRALVLLDFIEAVKKVKEKNQISSEIFN